MPSIKMPSIRKKSLNAADDVRTPPNTRVETVGIGGVKVGRIQLQPGWKWSEAIKPIAKTEFCEAAHRGYVISGRIHIVGNDGLELDLAPGDVYSLEPGHDAWVVGNEPWVALEFEQRTIEEYARPPEEYAQVPEEAGSVPVH
jgi:hypothetical protein